MGYQLQPSVTQPLRPPAEHDLVQVDDIVAFARLLWRRKWKLSLGVLTSMLVAFAYITLTPPAYESAAQVLVLKRLPVGEGGMAAAGRYYFEDDLTTHVSLIKSPWFIDDVVQKHQLEALPSLAENPDPVHTIIAQLTVASESSTETMEPSSSILKLSFRGPDPQDCTTTVKAIVAGYQEFLNETSRSANEDAHKLITQKAEAAGKQLEEQKAAYQRFRQETSLLGTENERAQWSQTRMAAIQARQSELVVRRTELETRLAALRTSSGPLDLAALALTTPATASRESNATREEGMLSDRLLPLLLQEKTLRKDYGPGHPDVRAVREQIDLARQFFTPSSPTREGILSQTDKQRLVDPLEAYVHSLEQQIQEINASQQALDQQRSQEQQEMKKLTEYEALDRQQLDAIARLTRQYETLLAQLQEVDLNKELVGYRMRVIAPPGHPVQVAPRPVLALALSLLLGTLGGFGWGWASEARDEGLRTPEEIHRRLGLPVLGCIPLPPQNGALTASANPTALASPLCVHHRPDSAEAEAYRGVRAALCFSILAKQRRVIVITSPNPGDGKTTLASNLAVSLARSGARVLLMDADLRRPCIHELFGRSAQTGLTTVLRGEARLDQAVQPSDIPGLWILPSGPLQADQADLLTMPQFQESLDLARRQYDFVLVDASALLEATDARVVAAQADGVLLAVRAAKHGRPQLEQALEILGQLPANLLGAVVHAPHRPAKFNGSTRKPMPMASRGISEGRDRAGSMDY